MSDELICVRCHQPVVTSRAQYDTFERMHYVCFHFAFEHMGDPDDACDDPSCPLRGRDLARAVERLGAEPTADDHGYIVRADFRLPAIDGPTLAAALIALAEQVNE